MNKINLILGFLLLLASCGGNDANPDGRPSEDEITAQIEQIDDSLKVYYAAIMNGETDNIPASSIQKAIDLHLLYYTYYPKGELAPDYLDKVQQLYLQEKSYAKSAEMCDTLIAKYPSYKNRNDVILSAASTYDYFLSDKVHAKKYYEMLLKSKKIDKETRQSVSFRLQHMDLSLDEMAALQIKQAEAKK